MKHFITKSNFIRITQKVALNEEHLKDEIYKKKIYFFNLIEQKKILSVKQFLVNSENEFYQFVGNGFIDDTYSFVNEESHFAKYHADRDCKGLLSTFKDFEIPVEIKFKANGEIDTRRVEEFRLWFKQTEIQALFHNNQKEFIIRLQGRFSLQNPPKVVELGGSGVQGITNLTQSEIENFIDDLLVQASRFYQSSIKNRKILVEHNFSKKTYLVTSKKYRNEPILNNITGYTDNEVKEVLIEFYTQIKKPIIDYLVDYWIIKLNPKLDFSSSILEQIQFKPCNYCVPKKVLVHLQVDIDDSDELDL
ncbi:hypothetical protein [Rufibacter sp. XAAS-G3-1]|uniref:hypothetical protein n=1 Tax=Rufibacter sp. XAAS-G3-1 TaxID=2729134 RepID=UPI0015E7E3E4|nr:hypothetical protein [Rufibacter sp. XAAS-G3-1]